MLQCIVLLRVLVCAFRLATDIGILVFGWHCGSLPDVLHCVNLMLEIAQGFLQSRNKHKN